MSILKRTLIWLGISIPPFLFFLFLARSLNDLPVTDDYSCVLAFLLQWKSEAGIQHIIQVATFQVGPYRMMFEHAVVGVQYAILGHTDLKTLAILGDLLVIPLFGLLYLMWWECGRPRNYTLQMFVPASWILFQLQYVTDLDSATASLQLIPVILFAVLACFLATKSGTIVFLGALLSLMLSIASNANGLFMIPIGIMIYLYRREFKRLIGWCCCGVVACVVYFVPHHPAALTLNTDAGSNIVVSVLQHISLVYALAFLGDIATIRNPFPAVLFGSVLVGVFIFATGDRLFARRPALFYSSLFFIVTGLAVSGLRSNLGLVTALGCRYRINSTMLVILLYFYLVDRLYGIRVKPLIIRVSATAFGVLLIGFNVASDLAGEKYMLTMQHKVVTAIVRWKQHEPRPPMSASVPDDFTAENESRGIFEPVEPTLSDSIREGILILPKLPAGN